MRVGFVFPPNRRAYESCYFAPVDGTRVNCVVPHSFQDTIVGPNIDVTRLAIQTAPLVGKVFRTVNSPSRYIGAESALRDSDAILSVELYSFLTRRYLAYAKEIGARALAVVWETIPTHPFYRFPPFSDNARNVRDTADGFIATTTRSADHLRKLGISGKRIEVVYPAVNVDIFRPRPFQSLDKAKERILYVGLLSGHKGFDVILKAYQKVRAKRDVSLTVLGDGPLRHLLDSKLGEGVQRLVNVPLTTLLDLYSSSSVFVSLPKDVHHLGMKTWEEQFGLTLVEAMSSGLPIVTSNCGAVPEIVGSRNSIVAADSHEGVAEAFEYLVDHPAEANEVGTENRTRAQKLFNSETQSKRFQEIVCSRSLGH